MVRLFPQKLQYFDCGVSEINLSICYLKINCFRRFRKCVFHALCFKAIELSIFFHIQEMFTKLTLHFYSREAKEFLWEIFLKCCFLKFLIKENHRTYRGILLQKKIFFLFKFLLVYLIKYVDQYQRFVSYSLIFCLLNLSSEHFYFLNI